MTLPGRLRRLPRQRSGSTIVEFALLAPILITMMLGVMQVGMAMQRYNALRGVAGEVARYAAVQYQKDNRVSVTTIQDWGRALATGGAYNLPSSGLTLTVTQAGTQRVAGATELTITISSQIASFLSIIDIDAFTITYSRPIFLVQN